MTVKGLEVFLYHDQYYKQRFGWFTVSNGPTNHYNRICARLRYRPKQVLYTFLQRLYEDFVSSRESPPNHVGSLRARLDSLERGLRLLEEVISFSHCFHDNEIADIGPLSPHPSCSFCGGELFRTAFLCSGSCTRDGTADTTMGSRIILCNLCVADGRMCLCGSLAPYRLQSLESLVSLRAKISDIVNDLVRERDPGEL